MKVFTKHERIKEFLLDHPMDGVEVLDEQKGAHFLLSGRYGKEDFHGPTVVERQREQMRQAESAGIKAEPVGTRWV